MVEPIPLPALSGPTFEPADGKPPRALIVLLHGVGADGHDLIGLAPYLGHHLPFARFVSPDAPATYDMAPMGRQWFSLRDRRPDAMAEGAETAARILNAYIEAGRDHAGVADGAVALLGFSQGAMMALHVGLRRTHPVAAIAAFSGVLMGADTLDAQIRSRPPVLLVHGDADPVVPVEATIAAERALAAAGVPVEVLIREDLGHGIDQQGIESAARFLLTHLRVSG